METTRKTRYVRPKADVALISLGGNKWSVGLKDSKTGRLIDEFFYGSKSQCIDFKRGINKYEDGKRKHNYKAKWWQWKNYSNNKTNA